MNIFSKIRTSPDASAAADVMSLFELSPDVYIIASPEGSIRLANPSARETLGYTKEELIGKALKSFIHQSETLNLLEMAIRKKTETFTFLHKDGRTVLISLSPRITSTGNISLIGKKASATELQNEVLKEQFELTTATLQGIINTIPQLVWTSTPFGMLDYCNEKLKDYTGVQETSLFGSGWLQMIHPDDRDKFIDGMTLSVLTGKPFVLEHRLKDRSGNYRWHLARATAIRREDGSVIKWIGTETDIEDQKKESEDQLYSFFDLSPDLLCIADMEGNFLRVNAAFCAKLGYSQEELLKRPYFSFIHPDDHPKTIEEELKIQSELKGSQFFNNRYLTKDGRSIWISWTYRIGINQRIYATGRDITAIKEKNDRLQEKFDLTSAMLSGFMNGIPTIVWTSTADGQVDYCNKKIEEYTGVKEGDFNGEKWQSFIHPEDAQKIIEKWNSCLLSGEDFSSEYRFKNKHGEYRWHLDMALPIRKEDGSILRWIGTLTDIQDQKDAQNAILQSQMKLKEVLSKLPIICWSSDMNGIITFCQGNGLSNIGLLNDELIGKNIFTDNVFSEEGRKFLKDALQGSTSSSMYFEGKRLFHTHYTLVPGGVVAVSLDITDQKLLQDKNNELIINEKAALESARLKSEFLANMSHEIRTPINGILGLHDLLMETGLKEEQRKLLLTAGNCANSLLRIINDILDISKVEAGKLEFEETTVNLDETLSEIKMLLFPQVLKKGLTFELIVDKELPLEVSADPVRIKQVLMNLVSNAIKFTASGTVALKCLVRQVTDSNVNVEFEVSDTGIGISDDVQSKLFTPFTQADASMTRKYGGTGLGLYISRTLVELMGGKLQMKSHPGKGTTFSFTIPLKKAVSANQEQKVIIESPTKKLKILVAEDNDINQLIVKKQLQKIGHDVHLVSNGEEALHSLEQDIYDLILMDCQMPIMDGLLATQIIRKRNDSKGRIPIIAMTAHALSGDRERCLAHGMDEYISKPMTTNDLKLTIDKVVLKS